VAIVPDDVMLSSPGFDVGIVLCGLFWTCAYLLIIRQTSRDGAYGMPVVAVCVNLSWEAVSCFTEPPPGFLRPIPFVWLLIDAVIAWQVLKYGPALFPRIPTRLCYGWFATALLLALIVMFELNGVFYDYYHDRWGLYAGFAAALMMAALFLFMLYSRASTAGQSLPIAVCMCLGNSSAGVAWLALPPPRIVASALQACLVGGTVALNILYIVLLSHAAGPRRSWGRAGPSVSATSGEDGTR
jgi:hypothetical protein